MSHRSRRRSKQNHRAWRIASWAGRSAIEGAKRLRAVTQKGLSGLAGHNAKRRHGQRRDALLYPQVLSDFIGQKEACDNLSVFIKAAQGRDEALDNVLISGPAGLGKTCLARIVANELGVKFHCAMAPMITKPADLAGLLARLRYRDVIFIDEVHRLNSAVEESLYPAIENHRIDIIVGEGREARLLNIALPPFTMIAATTRPGLLSKSLRDRFGIPIELDFYDNQELEAIIDRGARLLGINMTSDGANEIALRSRGTPRIALQLLRRIRDFAAVQSSLMIDRMIADHGLRALNIDSVGLDRKDRLYLRTVAINYGGGPVGVEALAATLSLPRDSIEDMIEPFLLARGFIERTPRGRLVTTRAFHHLGLMVPIHGRNAEGSDLEELINTPRVLH